MEAIHLEAVEKILSALFASSGDFLSSFLYGRPGAPRYARTYGAELRCQRADYLRAVLFIRQNGASYLRSISLSEARSMVTSFLVENYWHIRGNIFSDDGGRSYAQLVASENKVALAQALSLSAMFRPKSDLTLFPLNSIRVLAPFVSDNFFLISAETLSTEYLPLGVRPSAFDASQFPPLVEWDGRKHPVTTWLGVRSPLPLVSQKLASAILGAVALAPLPHYRYQHNAVKYKGGKCTFSEKTATVSYSDDPHVPPLMTRIVINETDRGWLNVLDSVIRETTQQSRSRLKALEYFYRAWFLDPPERFPLLCMALDSLVHTQHGHTAAAIAFIKASIGVPIDEQRLRLLMRIRGAVVHGKAPDVYDSESYESYYLEYEADPIRDIELVVSKCLRTAIFNSTLKCHADPNAARIRELQAIGRISSTLHDSQILPEDV